MARITRADGSSRSRIFFHGDAGRDGEKKFIRAHGSQGFHRRGQHLRFDREDDQVAGPHDFRVVRRPSRAGKRRDEGPAVFLRGRGTKKVGRRHQAAADDAAAQGSRHYAGADETDDHCREL